MFHMSACSENVSRNAGPDRSVEGSLEAVSLTTISEKKKGNVPIRIPTVRGRFIATGGHDIANVVMDKDRRTIRKSDSLSAIRGMDQPHQRRFRSRMQFLFSIYTKKEFLQVRNSVHKRANSNFGVFG